MRRSRAPDELGTLAGMHPIPVRKMSFDLPTADDLDPRWLGDDTLRSYLTSALSLYVHWLEPFLVQSLRRVRGRIRDATLREDLDRFCSQEAQHYGQHQKANQAILGRGYPGLLPRFEQLEQEFRSWLDRKDDRWRVGFAEGFEAYTTRAAIEGLESGLLDHRRTDPRLGALFKWHLAEEIEHRTVAFDVYQHLYGDYLFRVKMCWVAQWHLWRFCMDCTRIMSDWDRERLDASYGVSRALRWGATLSRLPHFFATYLPTYTPHSLEVPEASLALSEQLSKQARAVR